MSFAVVPPPHVPQTLFAETERMFEVGGMLWMVAYCTLIRQSWKKETYGVPFVILASNIAHEAAAVTMFAQNTFERVSYFIWFLLNLVIVFITLRNAPREWSHAPHIQRHLTPLFGLLALAFGTLQFALPVWFVDAGIGAHRGVSPPGTADRKELAFWSSVLTLAPLNLACVMQLIVRWDSRGHGVSVWALRAVGTFIGITGYFGVRWYLWPEAYEYVANPLAMAMVAIYTASDIAYGVVLYLIHRSRTEVEFQGVREKQ